MYQNALNSAEYPALYQVRDISIIPIYYIKYNFNIFYIWIGLKFKLYFSIAKWKQDQSTEE